MSKPINNEYNNMETIITNTNTITNDLKSQNEINRNQHINFSNSNIPINNENMNNLTIKQETENTIIKEDKKALVKSKKIKKFNVGKQKKSRIVSVFIPNNKTRKNKKEFIQKIKKNKIRTIKNFLLERGLIKIGSSCPNNVLRSMYENALMSGDLINTNADTLLHNFVKSETDNDDDEL